MLCDKCRARQANVHVTQYINGVKYEQNLCSECAGMDGDMFGKSSMQDMFQSMFQSFYPVGLSGIASSGEQMSAQSLSPGKTDQNGQCFEQFGLVLPELDAQKTKKDASKETEQPVQGSSQKEKLQAELKAALAKEQYERAAQIRDKIRALEE